MTRSALLPSCVTCGILAALLSAGCIPSDTKPAPEDARSPLTALSDEDLVDLWMDFASRAKEEYENGNPRPLEVAGVLADRGKMALLPIIEVLGDDEASAHAKLMAVRSAFLHIHPGYLSTLERILKNSEDATGQACAIALLAEVKTPTSKKLMREALEAEDRRVRFAAMSGLVNQGDPDIHRQLADTYSDEETTDDERIEIVRVFLANPVDENLPIFMKALSLEGLGSRVRTKMATLLGRTGGAPAIEVIRATLDMEEDPMYRTVGELAITAIEERLPSIALGYLARVRMQL